MKRKMKRSDEPGPQVKRRIKRDLLRLGYSFKSLPASLKRFAPVSIVEPNGPDDLPTKKDTLYFQSWRDLSYFHMGVLQAIHDLHFARYKTELGLVRTAYGCMLTSSPLSLPRPKKYPWEPLPKGR